MSLKYGGYNPAVLVAAPADNRTRIDRHVEGIPLPEFTPLSPDHERRQRGQSERCRWAGGVHLVAVRFKGSATVGGGTVGDVDVFLRVTWVGAVEGSRLW